MACSARVSCWTRTILCVRRHLEFAERAAAVVVGVKRLGGVEKLQSAELIDDEERDDSGLDRGASTSVGHRATRAKPLRCREKRRAAVRSSVRC